MTMRSIPLLLPTLLACSLPAQFSAALSANLPIQTTLATPSTAQPAGPLTSPGTVGITLPLAGTTLTSWVQWTPPTATALTCALSQQFTTGSLPGSFLPASFVCDTTLTIAGPAGSWGTLVVVAVSSGSMGWPVVDVLSDGSNDAILGPFYGSIGSGALRREWSLPVQLGTAPLPVRIALPTGSMFSPGYSSAAIEFVPWSTSAEYLGSGCATNNVGWIVGQNSNHDYALAVLPGSGAAAATLHARGYGPFQAFAVDLQSARLPVGTIGLGNGCDDLLLGASVTAPGVPAPFSLDDEWTLDVPVLPPGLTFYLQHVSLGGLGNPIYFGATNVVRYQT